MQRPRLRPPFKLVLPVEAPRLMAEIRARLGAPGSRFAGTVLRRHAELTIAPQERHLWSPHLSLDVFDHEGGARVRGRYGPHPHLWTLLMAIYGVLGMVAIAGAVFGISQLTLGWTPWALSALPLCALCIAATWIVSAVGQRFSVEQMEQLHVLVEECVQRASDPPPPPAVE